MDVGLLARRLCIDGEVLDVNVVSSVATALGRPCVVLVLVDSAVER